MVAWNPDVPNPNDSTPKWGGNSQPITQWQGDQTMEKLFGGIGNSLEIATKGIDFAIKNDIDKKAYAAVDSERDAYTAALEGGYAATAPKSKDAESAQRTAQGMGNTESPPQDIDKKLGYVQSIYDGAQAGKVNDTYYKGRLVAAVKDLRAEYPGYREYIDKKVASITGFDPANQKINDLLTDINNIVGKKNSEDNRILHRLEAAAVDGDEQAAQLWNLRKDGKISDEYALAFLAKQNKGKYNLEVLKREKDTVETNDSLGRTSFSRWFDNLGAKVVENRMSAMDDGLFKGNPELMNAVRLHNENVQKMDSVQLNQVASLLNQRVKETEDHLFAQAKTKNPQGLSAYEVLGPEEVNKRIQAQLAPMRAQVDHVRKGDLSAATFQTREVQSRQDDALADLYRDPKMAGLALSTHALTKGVGSDNVALKFLEGSNFVKNKQTIDAYLNRVTTLMGQQGSQDNPAGLITLKSEVQKYKQSAEKIPVATTTQGLMQRVEQMMTAPEDAKIPDNTKLGILKSISVPEGRGLLNEFKNTESRQSVYDKLTSPAFAREAWRVTRNSPEGETLWRQYEDFAKQEWGVGLFSNYIKDLSGTTLPSGYRLGWDDKKKEFTLNDQSGRNILYDQTMPITAGGDKYRGYETGDRTLQNFAPSLRQINKGVFNIRNIAEASGKTGNEIDAYVMGFMTQAGWLPSSQNTDYLPAHMVKAIYNTGLADSILKKRQQQNQSTGYAE